MNERLKELMLEAGYAAPEMAGRAQLLSKLIIKDILNIVEPKHDSRTEVFRAHRDLHNKIKKHFEIDQIPCNHNWVNDRHQLVQHGSICSKCFETSIYAPGELK